jgi:hypothetical protein
MYNSLFLSYLLYLFLLYTLIKIQYIDFLLYDFKFNLVVLLLHFKLLLIKHVIMVEV